MDRNIARQRKLKREYMRMYRLSHLEQERERDRRRRKQPNRISWRRGWDAAHRKQANQRARRWYKENKERAYISVRANALKKKYGITIEQYEQMFQAQGKKCGICKRPATNFQKGLAVDHDHTTSKVRGLLCGVCNSYLGRIGDSPKAIIEYFRQNGP